MMHYVCFEKAFLMNYHARSTDWLDRTCRVRCLSAATTKKGALCPPPLPFFVVADASALNGSSRCAHEEEISEHNKKHPRAIDFLDFYYKPVFLNPVLLLVIPWRCLRPMFFLYGKASLRILKPRSTHCCHVVSLRFYTH